MNPCGNQHGNTCGEALVKPGTLVALQSYTTNQQWPVQLPLEVQALESHVKEHAPAAANVTFKTLGFKAFPYSMPKDTIVNNAASKVSKL